MALTVSTRWLASWVQTPHGTDHWADLLTQLGLEVDDCLSLDGVKGVVIGQIQAVTPHPNADRLRVCQVLIGEGREVTIVCGCATVKEGLKVAVATVGTQLPNGLTIKSAKLRGVTSEGMLCSLAELGLAPSSQGIVHLEEAAPIGQAWHDYAHLPDSLLKLDMTPNRGDCLSLYGIARELVGPGEQSATPAWPVPEAIDSMGKGLDLQVDASVCPVYAMAKLDGPADVKTPWWMAERLRRAGFAVQNLLVVDVTQYVMLELGQPMHAFDARAWQGQVHVRKAQAGESLHLLNDTQIDLHEEDWVIADDEQAHALAGMMGGKLTAAQSDSTTILLESAHFCPKAIAYMGRRHRIQSDAAYRFERGVDPALPRRAMQRAIDLLQAHGAFEVTWVVIHDKVPPLASHRVEDQAMADTLGLDIPVSRIRGFWQRLGCEAVREGDGWLVTPPSYRLDWRQTVDSYEEIMRLQGCDSLPTRWPMMSCQPRAQGPKDEDKLLAHLVARGFTEAMTYSFIDAKSQALFGVSPSALQLNNPISQGMAVMRGQLWSGLCDVLQRNLRRQHTCVHVFEKGRVFSWEQDSFVERDMIAVASCGPMQRHWRGEEAPLDFYAMKGEWEACLDLLGWQLDLKVEAYPGLHPGQSLLGYDKKGRCVAAVGRAHPAVCRAFDLPEQVMLMMLDMTHAVPAETRSMQPLSKYPWVRRDLSCWFQADVRYQDVVAVLNDYTLNHSLRIDLVDFYEDDSRAGQMSLTVALYFRAADRTLVEEEVNADVEALQQRLMNTLGAEVRST